MTKIIRLLLIALCFAEVFVVTDAWLFKRLRLNCRVSSWSSWSTPYGFGQISRERTILRHPTNGGKPCPTKLLDIRYNKTPLTPQQTARSLGNNFLYRKSYWGRKRYEEVRDLLVILDSSGSISFNDFTTAKNALAKLLGLLCPKQDPFRNSRPHYQQAALLRFATNVHEIFDFNDNSNTQLVKNAITGTAYVPGSTCTEKAFNYATDNMFKISKGMRTGSGVKQEVLILTDGINTCGGNPVAAAKRLQGKAEVFALVIGKLTDKGKDEMSNYVSSPPSSHLFAVGGIAELTELVKNVESGPFECAPFNLSN